MLGRELKGRVSNLTNRVSSGRRLSTLKKKSTYFISLVVYQGGKVEAEMSAGSADEEDEEDEAFGRQFGQPN